MRDQWVHEESQTLSRAEGLCGPTHPTGAASRTRGSRTRPTEPPAGSLLLLAFCSCSLWAGALSPRLAAAYLPLFRGEYPETQFPSRFLLPRPLLTSQGCCPQTFPRGGHEWAALDQPGTLPEVETHAASWSLRSWADALPRAQPPLAGQVALSPGGCWRHIRAQIRGSLVFTHVTQALLARMAVIPL